MENELIHFIELVGEMRRQQKSYFTMRSPVVLRDACKLERDVDQEVSRLKAEHYSPQGVLFEE